MIKDMSTVLDTNFLPEKGEVKQTTDNSYGSNNYGGNRYGSYYNQGSSRSSRQKDEIVHENNGASKNDLVGQYLGMFTGYLIFIVMFLVFWVTVFFMFNKYAQKNLPINKRQQPSDLRWAKGITNFVAKQSASVSPNANSNGNANPSHSF